jgi:hypothetical protein
MNGRDHYLANAVECQSMAAVTRDASERGTWLEMAESWLRLAEAIKSRRNLVSRLTEGPFALPRYASCRLRKRIQGHRCPIAAMPRMRVSLNRDRE